MIKAPNWAKNAVPTLRGWETTKGELLIARRHTQAELDEFMAQFFPPMEEVVKKRSRKKKVDEEVKAEEKKMLTEAPVGNKSIDDMTAEEKEALQETMKTSAPEATLLTENAGNN